MKVFLQSIGDLPKDFFSGETLKATVSQRVEGGYIINLDGAEFIARSELDLTPGQLLLLKSIEVSPAQWILKVVQTETQEAVALEKPPLSPGLGDNLVVQAVLTALSKLNLPMTKDRFNSLIDMVREFVTSRESLASNESEMPFPTELNALAEVLIRTVEDLSPNPTEAFILDGLTEPTKEPEGLAQDAALNSLIDIPDSCEIKSNYPENPVDKTTIELQQPAESSERPQKGVAKPSEATAETLPHPEEESSIALKIGDPRPLEGSNPEVIDTRNPVKTPIRNDGPKSLKFENHNTSVKDLDVPIPVSEVVSKAGNTSLAKNKGPDTPECENNTATDQDKASIETSANQNRLKPQIIKDYLATKALSLAVKGAEDKQVSFFALPMPFFNTVFLKVERYTVDEGGDTPVVLSFIIDTHYLGLVKVQLIYFNRESHAQVTFEQRDSLEFAKNAITLLEDDVSPIIKTAKFQTGQISRQDFFLGNLKKDSTVLQGINIKI